jgi:hypothetical protein
MAPRQPPSDDEERRGESSETPRFTDDADRHPSQDENLRNSRSIIETARDDPTAPLHVGTAVDTDVPVTISSGNRYAPLLITASTGMGKTTLCHHLASQQLGPERGLCYLSSDLQPFESRRPNEREANIIMADTDMEPTDAVPDTLGRDATSHSVLFGSGTATEERTTLMSTLVDQVITNRHRQIDSDVSRYTLVLDGIEGRVEWNRINFRQLLVEAQKQRLSVIVATQSLTHLPSGVRQRLQDHVQTYLTGSVPLADANHLATVHPTATADDFHTIPQFRWWMYERTREEAQETQFTSPPRSSPQEQPPNEDREEV